MWSLSLEVEKAKKIIGAYSAKKYGTRKWLVKVPLFKASRKGSILSPPLQFTALGDQVEYLNDPLRPVLCLDAIGPDTRTYVRKTEQECSFGNVGPQSGTHSGFFPQNGHPPMWETPSVSRTLAPSKLPPWHLVLGLSGDS